MGLFQRFKKGAKKLGGDVKGLYEKGKEAHKKYQEESLERQKRKLAIMQEKSKIAHHKMLIAQSQAKTRRVQQSTSSLFGTPSKGRGDLFGDLLGTGGKSKGGFGSGLLFDTPKKRKKKRLGGSRSVTIKF